MKRLFLPLILVSILLSGSDLAYCREKPYLFDLSSIPYGAPKEEVIKLVRPYIYNPSCESGEEHDGGENMTFHSYAFSQWPIENNPVHEKIKEGQRYYQAIVFDEELYNPPRWWKEEPKTAPQISEKCGLNYKETVSTNFRSNWITLHFYKKYKSRGPSRLLFVEKEFSGCDRLTSEECFFGLAKKINDEVKVSPTIFSTIYTGDIGKHVYKAKGALWVYENRALYLLLHSEPHLYDDGFYHEWSTVSLSIPTWELYLMESKKVDEEVSRQDVRNKKQSLDQLKSGF